MNNQQWLTARRQAPDPLPAEPVIVRTLEANTTQDRCSAELERPSVSGAPVVVCWLGGVAGGKTTFGVDRVHRWIGLHDGIDVGVYRKTHNSFESTTGRDFVELTPRVSYRPKGDWTRWEFRGGGAILWVGLESYRDRRSMRVGASLIDQAETLDEDEFDFVIERTRQRGMPLQVLALANVPDSHDHWLYRRFDGSHPDYRMVVGGMRENEQNLPPGYFVAMTEGRSADYVARYVDNKWSPPSDQPPVYPSYRALMRLMENAPACDGLIHEGMDGGPTDKFFGCVWWQRQMGRIVALAEVLAENTGVVGFARRVLEIRSELFAANSFWTVGDPPLLVRASTDRQSAADVLVTYGIIVHPGESGMQARKSKINDILSRVDDRGQSVLAINPRCEILHRAMMGEYHFEKDEHGQYQEPKKNACSHVVEAFETSIAVADADDPVIARMVVARSRGLLKPKRIMGMMR